MEKRKILLVDDNATVLRSIKELLENSYDVTVAKSGAKALELMRKDKPDLILLDYEMPEMDGRDVFMSMRTDMDLFSIPVIFLTGVNDREHIAQALALRPAGYLLKPVSTMKLNQTIESVIREYYEMNGISLDGM